MKTWKVGPRDGDRIADVLSRLGAGESDIADGRVFVGKRRIKSLDEKIVAGDLVSVAPRDERADLRLAILSNEDDVVAVDKPAGIPTIPDHQGAAHSLIAIVARTLGIDEARLHPTSRLDRDVSGVVCFALSKAAIDRLAQARKDGAYTRRYVAIASRAPSQTEGVWDAPIGRAKDPRHRAAFGREHVPAKSLFRLIAYASSNAATLLALAPITGRTHQLRVHASHASLPLLGDRTYDAPPRITLPSGRILPFTRIALHAARITIPRARGGDRLVIDAPIPEDLAALWLALGGDATAWDTARLCTLAE